MRRLRRRVRRDERGVTMALFALLVTVMIVVAALVIDVAALQAERGELRNGADAAALALAQQCATGAGLTACPSDARAAADELADANAADGRSAVDSVEYGVDADTGARTVTVATSTETPSGTIVPYAFAEVVTGARGSTIHARATAAWGPLAEADVPSLAIGYCDWFLLTAGGADFSLEPFTLFDLRAAPTDCSGETGYPTGVEPGGGFAWLEGGAGCRLEAAAGEWYDLRPDLHPPSACDLATVGRTPRILVGVYDARRTAPGGSTELRLAGFAAIEMELFEMPPGVFLRDGLRRACPPGPAAVSHCFLAHVRQVQVPGRPGGGPDFGVAAVALIA